MKNVRRNQIKTALAPLFLFVVLLLSLALYGCGGRVTLRFYDGETQLLILTDEAGADVTIPSPPEKEGYLFVGWYSNAACTGEKQQLPDKMPQKSATYYAKFALAAPLALETGEFGKLDQTIVDAPVGESLLSITQEILPAVENERISFGGWYYTGRALSATDLMPENGATLTARYLTDYEVNVYRENVEGTYELCEQEGRKGKDYLGVSVPPNVTAGTGFYLDGEMTEPLILSATQENVLSVFISRNRCLLTYEANVPAGGTLTGSMGTWRYRYGSRVALEENGYSVNGYRFAGWRDTRSGADYAPGDFVTLTENETYAALWEKCVTDAFGGSDLIYLPADREGAVYLLREGLEEKKGDYDRKTGEFAFLIRDDFSLCGRIDERTGYFAYVHTETAGTYALYNGAEITEGTTLVLDDTCKASCTVGGIRQNGSYRFDKEHGLYVFQSEDNELVFFFDLERVNGTKTFRICGSERFRAAFRRVADLNADGTFSYYENDFLLSLDGFGVASLDGTSYEYAVTNRTAQYTEYELKNERESGRYALFTVDGEGFYLPRNEELAGNYDGEEGTLTLDGYGIRATLTPSDGAVKTGGYRAEYSPLFSRYLLRTAFGDYFAEPSKTEENGTFTEAAGFEEYRLFTGNAIAADRYLLLYDNLKAEIYAFGEEGFTLAAEGTYEKTGAEYSFEGTAKTETYPAAMRFRLSEAISADGERFSVYLILSELVDGETFDYAVRTEISSGGTLTVLRPQNATQENPASAWYDEGEIHREGGYYAAEEARFSTKYYVFRYAWEGSVTALWLRDADGVLTPLTNDPAAAYGARNALAKFGDLYADGINRAEVRIDGALVHGTYEKTEGGTAANAEAAVFRFTADGGETFRFLFADDGYYVYDAAYEGRYTGNGCAITLDGFGCEAVYRDARDTLYRGNYRRLAEAGAVAFTFIETGETLRFALNSEKKTFERLDNLYGDYENENGNRFHLDGAGNISSPDWKESGTYKITDATNAVIEVTANGLTATYRLLGTRFLLNDGIGGTYASEDWEVAILDGFGSVRFLDRAGVCTEGTYTATEGGLILSLAGETLELTLTENGFARKA